MHYEQPVHVKQRLIVDNSADRVPPAEAAQPRFRPPDVTPLAPYLQETRMNIPTQLLTHLGGHANKMKDYLTGDFQDADPEKRKQMAAEARKISAAGAAAIAPMPIPFADIFTITPVQMAMVGAIGNIYGYKLDEKTLRAVMGTVAGGWLGQQTCLALFKIGMPGAGGFGGAAFVFVWTHTMGFAAEEYFKSGMTATKKDLDAARKRGMEEAKRERKEG